MEDINYHNSVLSIGARKKVLVRFSNALQQEGFIAHWMQHTKNVEQIVKYCNPNQYDIIIFGRGVNKVQKERYMHAFSAQNPHLKFVEGLAPITNLLIDQIKLASNFHPQDSVSVKHIQDKLLVTVNATLDTELKLYHLNWLYQSQEKLLFSGTMNKGAHEVSLALKAGKYFLTVKQGKVICEVLTLNS